MSLNLNAREWNLLLATIVVILLGSTWMMGEDKLTQWKDLAAAREDLEFQKERHQQRIGRKEDLLRRMEIVKLVLPQHAEQQDLKSDFLQRVQNLADKSALNVRGMDPEKEKNVGSGGLFKMAINASWQGTLKELVPFLYDLQTQGVLMDVRQLNVKSDSSGQLKGNLIVDFAYSRGAGTPPPAAPSPAALAESGGQPAAAVPPPASNLAGGPPSVPAGSEPTPPGPVIPAPAIPAPAIPAPAVPVIPVAVPSNAPPARAMPGFPTPSTNSLQKILAARAAAAAKNGVSVTASPGDPAAAAMPASPALPAPAAVPSFSYKAPERQPVAAPLPGPVQQNLTISWRAQPMTTLLGEYTRLTGRKIDAAGLDADRTVTFSTPPGVRLTATQFLAVIETELENQGLKLAVQPDQSLLLTK